MVLLPNDAWHIKSDSTKGRGIFAKKEIPAGTVIGDYIGKVIHGRDEDKYDNDGHFYLMYYHEDALIYPEDINKPGIHLLNHSCTPNSWIYSYKGHALFFVLRNIFPGEEITSSYQLYPLDEYCKPCTHQCYCESVLCTGSMHMTWEKYDAWTTFDEKISKKTKRARVRFNKTLPILDSYPENIPDNPIYTLFGNKNEKPLVLKDAKLPSVDRVRTLIRESGKTLLFPSLNLQVFGVTDGLIVSQPNR